MHSRTQMYSEDDEEYRIPAGGIDDPRKPSKQPNLRPKMNRNQRKRPQEPIINKDVVAWRRKALGLSQGQLAIMAAVAPLTISHIERGIKLDPATSVTLRVAKALSLTVEALCADANPYTSRNPRYLPHGEPSDD